MKYFICKSLFFFVLRLPDLFFSILFKIVFPIYRGLHKKRAYGRVEAHLAMATAYKEAENKKNSGTEATQNKALGEGVAAQARNLAKTSADDVFKGIYWNAIDSYRGLARFHNVTDNIIFENEKVLIKALKTGPVAAISIHQGAFEILHRSLCRYSNNVHLITDTLGNGDLRKVIQELRSDKNLTEYNPEDTRVLVRNLFHTRKIDVSPSNGKDTTSENDIVSENGILAMVVDQGKHTKGNVVPLFGQDSTLYLRLPELVNQMGASVVTFRTWSETKLDERKKSIRKNIIRFETWYPPLFDEKQHSDHNFPQKTLVESIASEVENWIAEHPDQWSWNYHGNFRGNAHK